MTQHRGYTALHTRIRRSQELGEHLLARMRNHTRTLDVEDIAPDALIGNYIKLAQIQMKWAELELTLLRERHKQEAADAPHTTHTVEPISRDEWEVIAQHSAQVLNQA